MQTFTDNAGRTWTVQVNVDAVKRVRDMLRLDLLEVIEGKLLEKLLADPILLADVLYCLCKVEADTRQVSDSEFGKALAGDAIDAATTALLEELVGFFPKGKRALLARALAKLRQVEQAALDLATRRLDSPELEKRIAAELASLGSSSGSAPASSASIPAASP